MSSKTAKALIEKYNQSGPRYTSYPPVPFWKETPTEAQWIQHIKQNYRPHLGLDLYLHIPFCESLCFYCGCHRDITKNHAVEEKFIQAIISEFDLYTECLGFVPSINSLHLGGGTPTFLSPKNLSTLLYHLTSNRSENFLGSIEIDPRTCKTEHLDVLKHFGFSRISLGIQDFDPGVQSAINRHQTKEMVSSLLIELRERQFASINFDLIYGLPRQTAQSIADTIKIVQDLKPDLIAFYSYAHLPDRIKNQKLIKASELPNPESKRELYEIGCDLLKNAGYQDIGMDHFALPHNFLYQAKASNKLYRNFMGYLDQKTNILIGLGPSSISDSSESFAQNQKDLKQYYLLLEQNRLPIVKGHILSETEKATQKIILDLMCNEKAKLPEVPLPYWSGIQSELMGLEADGLIQTNEDNISVTKVGKAFLRNIAMTFDFHLRESKNQKFSQTI